MPGIPNQYTVQLQFMQQCIPEDPTYFKTSFLLVPLLGPIIQRICPGRRLFNDFRNKFNFYSEGL
jgi:hypothetical protein